MKFISLLLFLGAISVFSRAQLSVPDQDIAVANPNEEKLVGYYPNGNKQFEGYKRKENLHGQWKSWYSNSLLLDSGLLQKGIPNGEWIGWYSNGSRQFIRTYSSDKWQQFQNEKDRYHPKRVSMPLTSLYHENKKQAVKYITASNTFCAIQNCNRINESLQQTIDKNAAQHYHPIFENGLLHGPFANYFPDGTLKDSGNYKNGLPEGLWIKWTDDKQFYWKGYYNHGRKNKEWKLYSSSDKLIRIIGFRNGKYLWRNDMKEGVETTEEEMSGF